MGAHSFGARRLACCIALCSALAAVALRAQVPEFPDSLVRQQVLARTERYEATHTTSLWTDYRLAPGVVDGTLRTYLTSSTTLLGDPTTRDQADAAYIVLAGAADVLVDTPNGPLKVAEVGRDAFVGEIGILCDVPRTATIQATETLVTLRITKDLFYRMVADFPSISLEVMRVLAQRLEHMNEQLRDAVAAKH